MPRGARTQPHQTIFMHARHRRTATRLNPSQHHLLLWPHLKCCSSVNLFKLTSKHLGAIPWSKQSKETRESYSFVNNAALAMRPSPRQKHAKNIAVLTMLVP